MLMALWIHVVGAALADETPMYRFCVEDVEQSHTLRWEVDAEWPYLSVWWQPVSIATVRPLSVREPSWMWERPVLNQTIANNRTLVSTEAVIAGAVWYIDAELIDQDRDPRVPLAIEDARMRPNILSVRNERYEVEMCPDVRGALASR